jgi:hypothetical protein
MNLRDVLIAEKQRNNKTTATETIDNNSTKNKPAGVNPAGFFYFKTQRIN